MSLMGVFVSRTPVAALLFILQLFLLYGCTVEQDGDGRGVTIVFKHGKVAGDPGAFKAILRRFEELNPGIHIKDEVLPASTDEQHQFYVINLEGGTKDFDVLSMDVIWVQEFARAGWIRPLDDIFPPQERKDFFSGPMEAVTYKGSVYAVPWYIDAGLLYYRKDLLEKYAFKPPRTWDDLVRIATIVVDRESGLYGFVWQGKQYEGLVCNVLEYMWGNGGGLMQDGAIKAATRKNAEALAFMRALIVEHEVTPALVTTAVEETTRHIFGSGRAVFMRNWPYAWNIFNRPGSKVRGKVGVAPLPSFGDNQSASTLGGWQLGINRFSRHPEEAGRFIRFLTSYETQKQMALTVGYKPTRRSLYRDEELRRAQPFFASLYDIFERARPRPVTPYYMMISQIIQPEFSAAISGIKDPMEALRSIDTQAGHILEVEALDR